MWTLILRRFGLIALMLLCGSTSSAQQSPSGVRREHWIVLLDVSASLAIREQMNRPALLPRDYRLQNEALSLIHTLLAARGTAEQGTREDHLSVYFFGSGVYSADAGETRVLWDEAKDDDWWESRQQLLPEGIRDRTDLRVALARAVADFQNDPDGWGKHLILISDGELDVEPSGRNPGEPPALEELEAYQEILTLNNPTIRWLELNDVAIHALAVDDGWRGTTDEQRQRDIRMTLNNPRLEGLDLLERADALIRDRASVSARQQYESEGPFVMQALAEALGGEYTDSRSVRPENLYDVLWKTVFPQASNSRYLAPGTRTIVLLSEIGEPVLVDMQDGSTVTLRYDARTGETSSSDPQGLLQGYSARVGTRYITWIVHSDEMVGVSAGSNLFVVPINDVELRWQPARPPRTAARGQVVPIEARLIWNGKSAMDDIGNWRERMRNSFNSIVATAQASGPSSRVPIPITLRPELVNDSDSVLMVFSGSYTGTQAEGMHLLTGGLIVQTEGRTWTEELLPLRLEILARAPARPRLSVSAEVDGSRSERVDLPPPPAVGAVPIEGGSTITLHFTTDPGSSTETRGDRPSPVQAVPISLSVLGPDGRELGRAVPIGRTAVAGGDRYEFSPIVLPKASAGDSLSVRVEAGAVTYDYLLATSDDGPPWWLWLLVGALVLSVVLFALYMLFRGGKPITEFIVVIDGQEYSARGDRLVVEHRDGRVSVPDGRPRKAADAVQLCRDGGVYFRLEAVGKNSTWKYRKFNFSSRHDADGEDLFLTVGPGGHRLRRTEMLDGWGYEIDHGGRVVEIRPRDLSSAHPSRTELSRTQT